MCALLFDVSNRCSSSIKEINRLNILYLTYKEINKYGEECQTFTTEKN